MAKELPKRSEVKEEFTWKIEDVFPDTAAWEAELQNIQTKTAELAGMEGKVTASAENLLSTLEQHAALDLMVSRTFHYASRLSDVDTKNSTNQAMVQRISSIATQVSSKLAFIDPESTLMFIDISHLSGNAGTGIFNYGSRCQYRV